MEEGGGMKLYYDLPLKGGRVELGHTKQKLQRPTQICLFQYLHRECCFSLPYPIHSKGARQASLSQHLLYINSLREDF